MKVLHLNAGNETGGGMFHILSLLQELDRDEFILGVLEKGELLERANDIGIQTVYFSNKTRLSIPLIQKIKNYIIQERIQIVHTHGPRANVYASILKKMIPFQWIVTIHSNPMLDFMGKGIYGEFLCKINLAAIKRANKLIAISEQFRNHLIDVGIEKTKIVTALNGINFREKNKVPIGRENFGFIEDDFLILMVARLEYVKGHPIAFKAFANLLREDSKCQLILVGDGMLKDELVKLSEELNIHENVHFMGYRDDVDCFYEMSDITLLASLSESFPLVLLESARAKTPVIATEVGGVKTLIKDKSVGWIVQPENVGELSSALKEALLLHKEGKLEKVGQKLHNHASNNFTIENFAKRVYDIYLRVSRSI